MPTRQQLRARQHQQRRRSPALEAAEATPVIVKGRDGLRRFRDAVDAYETDMAAAFRVCQDAIDEARDDCERKIAAANAEYERAHAAVAAAYAQRTADSHKPEPEPEPDGETETETEDGEPDVQR